jgi:peroxiredoxin
LLEAGATIPDATVFAGPREPIGLRELAGERPFLLVFYLFDWSST